MPVVGEPGRGGSAAPGTRKAARPRNRVGGPGWAATGVAEATGVSTPTVKCLKPNLRVRPRSPPRSSSPRSTPQRPDGPTRPSGGTCPRSPAPSTAPSPPRAPPAARPWTRTNTAGPRPHGHVQPPAAVVQRHVRSQPSEGRVEHARAAPVTEHDLVGAAPLVRNPGEEGAEQFPAPRSRRPSTAGSGWSCMIPTATRPRSGSRAGSG